MASYVRSRPVALTLAAALLSLIGVSAAPNAQADSPSESAAVSASLSAAVPAPAPVVIPFVVPEGALFTRPPDAGGTPEEELAWNLEIEHLLDATPAGQTVTGSLFSLTSTTSQAAIKRADKRGVKIRLLLYSGRADDTAVRSLVKALNDGKTRGSWAKVCYGSCYGFKKAKKVNPGVQHFKAFTFSKVMESDTQAATNVWTAGSGNLTNGGSGFNSYVTKKNSPKTYAALNAYMVGMRADKESRPGVTRTVEEGIYKMYLYPQRSLTPDIILDTLKVTGCVVPGADSLTKPTVVRVGMFTWTSYRKLDIELIRLHRAGCDVQVVVSAPTTDKAVMKNLVRAGVPVFNAQHNTSTEFYYLHDKNLIIDGAKGGSTKGQVYTGSNNFTEGGLIRNTESIIRIQDRTSTDQFLANWSLIQSYSAPITVDGLSKLSAKSARPLDPDNMEPTGR